MNDFAIVVTLSSVIISLVFIIKWWVTCNAISDIKAQLSAQGNISDKNYLLYLHRTNAPNFEQKLTDAMYNDLYVQSRKGGSESEHIYTMHYEAWMQMCTHYGWRFPELLAGLETKQKFCAQFHLPKSKLEM